MPVQVVEVEAFSLFNVMGHESDSGWRIAAVEEDTVSMVLSGHSLSYPSVTEHGLEGVHPRMDFLLLRCGKVVSMEGGVRANDPVSASLCLARLADGNAFNESSVGLSKGRPFRPGHSSTSL